LNTDLFFRHAEVFIQNEMTLIKRYLNRVDYKMEEFLIKGGEVHRQRSELVCLEKGDQASI
jgi:hypothetical protein